MTVIYGIKNCDTMKKALKWLDENEVNFTFHDYKKQGLDESVLQQALNEHGWESVINRRGTTWKRLPEKIRAGINNATALQLAQENASIIKRPLLTYEGKIYLGFNADTYSDIFT